MKLTHKALHEHNTIRHDNRRVRVYTASGTQIGLPGIGKSLVDLTFPGNWRIRQALFSQHDQYHTEWIRFATEKEEEEEKNNPNAKWWRMSELQPKAFLDAGGCAAALDDSMDQRGLILIAIACIVAAPVMQWEEREKAYVDHIPAPTTPETPPRKTPPRKRSRCCS